MRRIIFIFFYLFVSQGHALETDNYLVWKQELDDSSKYINRYFSENIQEALSEISDHREKDCYAITKKIAKRFSSRLVHDNPVENYLFSILSEDEIFPRDLNYVDRSIYREPYRFYIPWFGLAPSIQVNGYYFGTDKLSHFASTGMQYYQVYYRELQKNHTPEEALKKSIQWGILDERGIHGYLASGILSYADLESNYQGLKFYKNFCHGDRPYLARSSEGRWELRRKPSIRDYVSGYWDETFEISYRLSGNWKKVAPAIKNYCQLSNSERVSNRLSYYRRTSIPSPSVRYLNSLKKSGKLPDPSLTQSFEQLCFK